MDPHLTKQDKRLFDLPSFCTSIDGRGKTHDIRFDTFRSHFPHQVERSLPLPTFRTRAHQLCVGLQDLDRFTFGVAIIAILSLVFEAAAVANLIDCLCHPPLLIGAADKAFATLSNLCPFVAELKVAHC